MTTKITKTGRIAVTDSLTPRMLRTVRTTIAASSIATFTRCTGSSQVPMSASGEPHRGRRRTSARGIMLKMASPPDGDRRRDGEDVVDEERRCR